ncbi:hypothetical protein ELI30_09395 [Rhizobium leguminosarum]|uniref:hypothetical protein n=1 Tax=Rhizobium leguminosarum TaxID=384 RepID=UPI00102FC386|nr:hypothetical protein [Rhizobium leguminosarum]TAV48498.1 hypothetical protein ELI32_09850 [Rhizobium leguminosarum]TAV57998.1 hypothetical protein ELI31_09380 [Rhizobium leguminosarum]TAV68939.1 hypothetical protein ELI30_09395 [Rhizobium leguminosarum]
MRKRESTPSDIHDLGKKTRVKRPRPEGGALNVTESADLLGISRGTFYKKLELFNLEPIPLLSTEHRPMYRREDVLRLLGPQGGQQIEPDKAVESAPAEPAKATTPPVDPKKVRAVDAGYQVPEHLWHLTVEEFRALRYPD